MMEVFAADCIFWDWTFYSVLLKIINKNNLSLKHTVINKISHSLLEHIRGFSFTQYRIKGLTKDDAERQRAKLKLKNEQKTGQYFKHFITRLKLNIKDF